MKKVEFGPVLLRNSPAICGRMVTAAPMLRGTYIMERSQSKAERLLQLEQILLAYPEGLRKAEIARRLGVHRATVARYLEELGQSRRVPIWQDGDLFGIDRDQYLTHVRLTIHESMALHLAARLMATRTDKHNPHAASALRKLGQALSRFAPLVSRHLLASADVMDDVARRHDPVYLQVLETLTRAWSQGQKVRLWYQKGNGQPVGEYLFAPYFIEPYGIGQTAYVIGWRDDPPGERTLKLERIRRIELTDKPYQIPDNFNPLEKLAGAWGIWYGEGTPEQVILRFHPRVAERVQETQWMPGEQVEMQADGYLHWRARVAEPREMKPWIRGWGADCEVLAPEWLREEIAIELRQAAGIYAGG
ncbi:MAG: WYL domain-containing transcriptional regulator [Chloroflexi bacterium]|nr:MAG: WYL domain-containing transcriptional regulator [Chloroflexota bacterium]